MNIILDTHTFLWAVSDPAKLSSGARAIYLDEANELWLSVASIWEMAIKVSLSKLTLAKPIEEFIPEQLQINGIRTLDVTPLHALHVAKLPLHHRDPFDRLLVAQSIEDSMGVLSADTALDAYGVQRMW